MKIKKFLKNLGDIFKQNKKELNALQDTLHKLENKKEKLLKTLNKDDDEEYSRGNTINKIKMINEMISKIKKKILKLS